MGINLFNEDCLHALVSMDDNCVDSLITDPPAGISFMGKDWDHNRGGRDEWIGWMTNIMRECFRVMKPGAHGLVWALPRTSHWTATSLENAGFEVRDIVSHLFGTGFPKSLDISKAIDKQAGAERATHYVPHGNNRILNDGKGKAAGIDRTPGAQLMEPPITDEAKIWEGWGTALKPACEHWILVRKPISEKTVAKNVLKHGTGGINIDGGRIGFASKSDEYHRQNTTQKHGIWDNCSAELDRNSHAQGRFPANLVLSHTLFCTDQMCDESCPVRMLDEQSGLRPSSGREGSSGSGRPGMFAGSVRMQTYADTGGASRFFYCAKAGKAERNKGLEGMPEKDSGAYGEFVGDGRGRQTEHTPRANHHPTVKAQKLMEYLIKLITPQDGTVLDPFMGSGSTGVACQTLGFKFIGIEKEKEYFEIAERRIG